MFGPENDISIYGTEESQQMGLIPRCIREVIEKVGAQRIANQKAAKLGSLEEPEEISLYCSFMQIYNDQPYDLLRDPNRVRPLKIHENTNTKEIYVVGLSEYAVSSLYDCMALVEQGDEHRACRETLMNDVSSRSHSIFQVVVERRKLTSGRVIRSKLNLVDLAGSEKWGSLDSSNKSHISELTNINTSLHTLGRCIAALTTTSENQSYVPFRDSKLTRILQDALGGNSRTCVIATLSPAIQYVDESISTLKFADSAKRVMQHARVVETREINLELVERLEREIEHLKSLLGGPQNGVENGVSKDPQTLKSLFENNEKVLKLEKENEVLRKKVSTTVSPETKSMEDENRTLKNTLQILSSCANRFFKFEIEEEEFQVEFQRYLSSIPSEMGVSTKKHRKLTTTGPEFRMRGVTGIPESPAGSKPKDISTSLKEKQKELEKNRKLQQWLAEKAQRELEKLETEKRIEEIHREKKSRDAKFSKKVHSKSTEGIWETELEFSRTDIPSKSSFPSLV